MKRNFLFIVLIFLFCFFPFFQPLEASDPFLKPMPNNPSINILEQIYKVFIFFMERIYQLLFIGGVIGVILGSAMLIFSGGDTGKMTSGKKIIIYSLIAVFVASFAWALITWIRTLNPTASI